MTNSHKISRRMFAGGVATSAFALGSGFGMTQAALPSCLALGAVDGNLSV